MAKILDGTLRTWQDTETIHAAEYNQEREIIRVAINDNNDRLSSLESSTAGILLGTAQLQKITNDLGGVKISVNDTILGDVLKSIKDAGVGLHTFYAVSGSKNLPSNKSIRGIAHITSANPTFGWVWATDYDNTFFHNYIDNDKWQGWDGPSVQSTLWTGKNYMFADQTVTPTKKLSECKTGWVLVWSDYNPSPANVAGDFDIVYSLVPKESPFTDGYQTLFQVPSTASATTTAYVTKKLRVYDNRLVGFDENSSDTTGANDVVLRNVLEY